MVEYKDSIDLSVKAEVKELFSGLPDKIKDLEDYSVINLVNTGFHYT